MLQSFVTINTVPTDVTGIGLAKTSFRVVLDFQQRHVKCNRSCFNKHLFSHSEMDCCTIDNNKYSKPYYC